METYKVIKKTIDVRRYITLESEAGESLSQKEIKQDENDEYYLIIQPGFILYEDELRILHNEIKKLNKGK